MTHPQISQAVRLARHKEQPKDQPRTRPAEDPELRRMLATHIHCGEPMQLVTVRPALPDEGFLKKNDGGLVSYRCACGFSFDHQQG